MNARAFEPMLINATIKTIDSISRKAAIAERKAEGMVGRLLARWDEMEPTEKEHVIGIVIATATTAVTAIAAMKARRRKAGTGGGKRGVKKAGKIVKAAVRKVT